MDKVELGLVLTGRISRGECLVCGELISKEKLEENTYVKYNGFPVEIHRRHDKTL